MNANALKVQSSVENYLEIFKNGQELNFGDEALATALLGDKFDLDRLKNGTHHEPHAFLGAHQLSEDVTIIRAFLPTAEQVNIESRCGSIKTRMQRIPHTDFFVALLDKKQKLTFGQHYLLHWQENDGLWHGSPSAYSFLPTIGEIDLHLFAEGRHWNLYQVMGANVACVDGIDGVKFSVWAPSAERVSVVGDFNGWHGLRHPMRAMGSSGVWELFIPGLHNGDVYKFEIRQRSGAVVLKSDPYAKAMEMRPANGSKIHYDHYLWQDNDWMTQRSENQWAQKPMSIYEVHLGSWKRDADNQFLNYRQLAHELVDYVKWMGYTHIELLPISEHPLDASWGYQVSGYFAPTSRFGTPEDFKYFVDYAHQHNIGVFLDWVPAHFPKDSFALGRFDGSALYEHEDPRQGEHQDWGTYIFNFGRKEVLNFLISNALYWCKEFHLDGLRVDAVASMLYLDYSREDGQWVPNIYGGRENIEAIEFLQTLNHEVHDQCPGAVMMAEESTSWPMVSKPTWMGGLGFSMKWNMGWMNDTLDYMSQNPVYRSYYHNNLTFSQIYAYSENFVLPISHDEVVHLKGSLMEKMPGDSWQKAANVRLLLAYQMLHPGKKLLFMGCELGAWHEWSEAKSLDWHLCEQPLHRGIMLMQRALNHLYQSEAALHQHDFDSEGFEWIDCHDYEQSVLSFQRKAADERLVCIFNFTPVVRNDYRIGVPDSGQYEVVFNSDHQDFNGSGVGYDNIHTEAQNWMNHSQSINLQLPPLGVLVLKHMR
jgi:1,4-alpha-glucan branching enzyme